MHIKPVAVGFFCAIAMFHSPALAQSIPQGEPYITKPGDTLWDIGKRAYGRPRTDYLYQVNKNVIGDDRNKLDPGVALQIPEISPPPPPPNGDKEDAAIDPKSPGEVIAVLTGDDFPPFVDSDFPHGGMFVALFKELNLESNGRPSKLYVVENWRPHLKELIIERRAFDMAFSWYKPDCSNRQDLGKKGQFRCDNFRFSNWNYEVGMGFYSKKEDALQRGDTLSQLRGKIVCRPKGYFTFDLVQAGLISADEDGSGVVTLYKAGDITECFEQLRDGGVNFVTANKPTSEATIKALGMVGDVVPNPGIIESTQTLHFIVPKNLREGSALMARLDERLRELEATGKADAIIVEALEAYR